MKPGLIRWSDKNIGRLFCFFLTLHRRIFCLFKKNTPFDKKPSKILFIKLIEQGSTVLAYPALKKAQALAGKENVYFMVFKENRPILDILNEVNPPNIIEIESKTVCKFIYSALKALCKVRREKIDAVIDMEFFSRASAIISYLSGADKRVGLHRFSCEGPYRGDLFTHRLMYNPYLHTKVFFAGLVEALNHGPMPDGAPMVFKIPQVIDTPPRFSATEDERRLLVRKIEKLKGSSLKKPIIILNPNTGDLLPVRKWPEENFIRLGKMLLEDFANAAIIITGTLKEKEKADKIASKIGNSVSLAGHTTLKELLTLYNMADVLVTNDSGPAHFSSLTSVRSVIFFGPETPVLYGEAGKDKEIISADLICSPCVNVYNHRRSPCRTALCLRNITAEDVRKAVKKMI